jgi:hypothetical protein
MRSKMSAWKLGGFFQYRLNVVELERNACNRQRLLLLCSCSVVMVMVMMRRALNVMVMV